MNTKGLGIVTGNAIKNPHVGSQTVKSHKSNKKGTKKNASLAHMYHEGGSESRGTFKISNQDEKLFAQAQQKIGNKVIGVGANSVTQQQSPLIYHGMMQTSQFGGGN
jgi:hypothetical protein